MSRVFKSPEGDWVSFPLGDWTVAYRIFPQNGRLVVGELRVIPRWDDAPTDAPIAKSAPPGGLSTRFLRSITSSRDTSPREALNTVRESMQSILKTHGPGAVALGILISGPEWLKVWEEIRKSQPKPPRHLYREDRIRWLAAVAEAYVAALNANSDKPNEVVAQQLRTTPTGSPLSASKVRDYVRQARQVDPPLLTETIRGKGGGDLTDRAREVLKNLQKALEREQQLVKQIRRKGKK